MIGKLISFTILTIFYAQPSSQPSTQSFSNFPFTGTGPYTSLFGEENVEERYDWILSNFFYAISTEDLITTSSGNASAYSLNSILVAFSGTTPGSYCTIQSRRNIEYIPGHEAHAIFFASFADGPIANTISLVGPFNSTDGMAVGYTGTQFGLLYRNNGVDTFVPSSSFNVDKLNGTGPSGFSLNPQSSNLFRIVFGWLSSSPIVFQVLNRVGQTSAQFITFHVINPLNTTTLPSFSNPLLPMTAQATNINSTGVGTHANVIGWGSSTVQIPTISTLKIFDQSFSGRYSYSATQTENMIAAFQNSTTFKGKINGISVIIDSLAFVPYDSTVQYGFVILRKNPTISGATFSSINTESVLLTNGATGTLTSGTGKLVAMLPIAYSSGGINALSFTSDKESSSITLSPGDVLSINIINYNPAVTSVSIAGQMVWSEVY